MQDVIDSIPDDVPYFYFVINNTERALYVKSQIKLRRPSLTSRIRVVDLYSLRLLLDRDPLLIYIDPKVYDSCTSKEMAQLHAIESAAESIFYEGSDRWVEVYPSLRV